MYYNEKADVLLLGWVWQTDPQRMSPAEEIERAFENSNARLSEECLMTMEETWCGRYVMIHDGNVYLDASSLLGVFYSDYGISSSVAILSKAMGLEERIWHPDKNIRAVNFLMGVHTQYKEIKRLVASQIYNYKLKTIRSRQLLPLVSETFANDDERTKRFVELFTHSLRNMAAIFKGKKLLVALTGGYDSRTLFALMHHASIDFECFTIQHDDISSGDVEFPKKLCQATGHKHHFIERNKKNFSKECYNNYEKHTAGLANDGDKWHYSYGQYQRLVEKFGECILLRGSVWETAVEYFSKYVGEAIDLDMICSGNLVKKSSMVRESLAEYICWAEEYEQKGLSWCNRFYWEQRLSNWMSSIEQGFDMMDGIVSIQPANSRVFMGMLLGFRKEDRLEKKHEQQIIDFACPTITSIPYAVYDLAGRWGTLRNLFHKWETFIARLEVAGIKNTAMIYIKILKIKLERGKQHKGKKSYSGIFSCTHL